MVVLVKYHRRFAFTDFFVTTLFFWSASTYLRGAAADAGQLTENGGNDGN